MRSRKGIYTIITTFFFIIIVLAVALGIIAYANSMANINKVVDRGTSSFVVARNVRDTIYHCHGNVINEERLASLTTCLDGSTIDITEGLIRGFRIRKLEMQNCTAGEWSSVNIDDIEGFYENRFVYTLPILEENSYVCLGLLEVYI